ncbi:MAG: efflux RND transporter periplasmic adaptor subunit [Hyphomicrobiaceae bacterium]
MTTSELFELEGTLRDKGLSLTLKKRPSGAIVRDARVEITADGETAVAVPQPDGSYLLNAPALANAGDHKIIATIASGHANDLLVGTLSARAATVGSARDHSVHLNQGGEQRSALMWLVQRPLVVIGAALAIAAMGLMAGLLLGGRPISSLRLLAGGALLTAGALMAGGMVQGPAKVAKLGTDSYQHDDEHTHGEHNAEEGVVKISAERIAAARIGVGLAGNGTLLRRLTVPGVVVPDSDRQARVAAQVVGTVSEMRKRVGDAVARGEVIAIVSSREVADAKSEYLAAVVNCDLQKTLYERSAVLRQKGVTPEQQFLQVKAAYTQAQLRLDLARQKLSSLGLDAKVVAQEAKEDSTGSGPSRLRTYEVRAPLDGRVVERKVDVGAPVGKEGDASELYSIADLSTVWVELAVPLGDLDAIKEGQTVTVAGTSRSSDGKIVFVSPMIDPETRSARVIAALPNSAMRWRPGTYVTAQVVLGQQNIGVRVPRSALQTIEGQQVVFVRNASGFVKREVTVGNSDRDAVEVVSGLFAGEQIAVSNTFLLKADLGKSEAEHSH